MNPNAIAQIPQVAAAVLAAIPADTTDSDGQAARQDMQDALRAPTEWVLDLGSDDARAALERAVEATAEYTVNGWEDDSARDAINIFNNEDNA